MAVLYASHYMEEVQAICDRVAIMDHGHILRNGPLGDLLQGAHARTDVRVAHWDSAAASEFAELAEVIADKNPHAIRGAKRLCNMLGHASDAEILQAESDEQVKVIRTPNQMEAVMAGMQKRKPNFVD